MTLRPKHLQGYNCDHQLVSIKTIIIINNGDTITNQVSCSFFKILMAEHLWWNVIALLFNLSFWNWEIKLMSNQKAIHWCWNGHYYTFERSYPRTLFSLHWKFYGWTLFCYPYTRTSMHWEFTQSVIFSSLQRYSSNWLTFDNHHKSGTFILHYIILKSCRTFCFIQFCQYLSILQNLWVCSLNTHTYRNNMDHATYFCPTI